MATVHYAVPSTNSLQSKARSVPLQPIPLTFANSRQDEFRERFSSLSPSCTSSDFTLLFCTNTSAHLQETWQQPIPQKLMDVPITPENKYFFLLLLKLEAPQRGRHQDAKTLILVRHAAASQTQIREGGKFGNRTDIKASDSEGTANVSVNAQLYDGKAPAFQRISRSALYFCPSPIQCRPAPPVRIPVGGRRRDYVSLGLRRWATAALLFFLPLFRPCVPPSKQILITT